MKMPITWYENNIKNMKKNLQQLLCEHHKMEVTMGMARSEIAILEDQIRAAKEQGKDGFDQDKFLKKRANRSK